MNKNEVSNPYLTYEQMNIIINSQGLVERITFFIRSLMFAVLRDPERRTDAFASLYDVIGEFYNYTRFFYGPEIAKQISNYLTTFITGILRFYDAISSNNQEAINSITVEMYNTANQLSEYLAETNLYFSAEQWRNYFYQYIRTIIDETLAIATKDFSREYQLFEQLVQVAQLMGNYLARGIISRSTTPNAT